MIKRIILHLSILCISSIGCNNSEILEIQCPYKIYRFNLSQCHIENGKRAQDSLTQISDKDYRDHLFQSEKRHNRMWAILTIIYPEWTNKSKLLPNIGGRLHDKYFIKPLDYEGEILWDEYKSLAQSDYYQSIDIKKNSTYRFTMHKHLKYIFKSSYSQFKDNEGLKKIVFHEMTVNKYGEKVVGRDVFVDIDYFQMSELQKYSEYKFFEGAFWHLYDNPDNSNKFPFKITIKEFI
jgi:hypothetical protein